MRLVGTTKSTIAAIRERTHWNATNLQPMDPVTLGLCSQIDLDFEVHRAAKEKPIDVEAQGATLLPASETTLQRQRAGAGREEAERRTQRRCRVRQAQAARRQGGISGGSAGAARLTRGYIHLYSGLVPSSYGYIRAIVEMHRGLALGMLLQYKGETGSGVPKGWTGIHHFGFQCDDLPPPPPGTRTDQGAHSSGADTDVDRSIHLKTVLLPQDAI